MEVKGQNEYSGASKVAEPEAPKKGGLGSRIIFALAFSTIGAKLSLIGTAIDGASLLQGEQRKFRAIFNGTLQKKLIERVMESNPMDMLAVVKATTKAFKYTAITTVVGVVAGGVLGWVRGNRVEHAKDILVHPIKSLKLVFGFGPKPQTPEPQESARPSIAAKDNADTKHESADNSTRWREHAAQRTAGAATAAL